MKTLIDERVIDIYKKKMNELECKEKFKLLQEYQKNQETIKTFNEITFQSAFLQKIFVDILGFTHRGNDISNANLLLEYKNPNSGEKVDAVLLDADKNVKVVIELKSLKSPYTDLIKKKRDGVTPLQQANKYLFQIENAEIGILSNFNDIIIFTKKEAFRQEFKLFDMQYDEFKEFYLLLKKSNIDNMLICNLENKSNLIDTQLDQAFYEKMVTLYNILKMNVPERFIDDLFLKFLSLLILEDRFEIDDKNIKSVNKVNETHLKKRTHWDSWKEWFRILKKDNKLNYVIFKNQSYFNLVKIPKKFFNLLENIAEYDLVSDDLDRMFFKLSENLYKETLILEDLDDVFEIYKGCGMVTDCRSIAFATKKSITMNDIWLNTYNELSTDDVEIQFTTSDKLISNRYIAGVETTHIYASNELVCELLLDVDIIKIYDSPFDYVQIIKNDITKKPNKKYLYLNDDLYPMDLSLRDYVPTIEEFNIYSQNINSEGIIGTELYELNKNGLYFLDHQSGNLTTEDDLLTDYSKIEIKDTMYKNILFYPPINELLSIFQKMNKLQDLVIPKLFIDCINQIDLYKSMNDDLEKLEEIYYSLGYEPYELKRRKSLINEIDYLKLRILRIVEDIHE